MSTQRYLWQYPGPVPVSVQKALDTFSPPMQSVLNNRGITSIEDAHDFLVPQAPAWADETNLRDSLKASELIIEAIGNNELIGVYGDYDADGITSTALLTLGLRDIGATVIAYIPDRLAEGYGLNTHAIKSLNDQGVTFLITVDNGIRSYDEVAYANSLNMKVVITDHHTPGDIIPPAAAILNPKQHEDPYPNKELAGVGVAYKLLCALSEFESDLIPDDYLDLVAIGTVADIVPLTGENRYLVRQGLTRLNFNQRQSILSLLGASGNVNKIISSSDISYQIAPRLNSSGRLEAESAMTPLNLLLASNIDTCSEYAQKLENHNYKRRTLSKELENKVEEIISDQLDELRILIALTSDISIGLAGIAAGYLARKYNLPAIVGNIGHTETIASCRSVPGFNIIQALDSFQDLLEQYGGHSMAAGFTIRNKNIPLFQTSINNLALTLLPDSSQLPPLEIDAEVKIGNLDHSLYKEILKLEPTGEGNPAPIFTTENLKAIKPKRIGKNSDHLKMTVTDGIHSIDAICFGMGHLFSNLPPVIDLAYKLTVNDYLGPEVLQLQVIDLKPS
jgi:single-stranded-DNA-specific exonuclease